MKSFIKTSAYLCLLVFAFSCQNISQVKTVRINDTYSMDLPTTLSQTDELNDEASLQYYNTLMELYVIVLDEPKSLLEEALEENELADIYSADLDGYTDLLTDSFLQSLDILDASNMKRKTINGLMANEYDIIGRVEGVDAEIYYQMAFIEGKDNYYQILVWTLSKNKNKYSDKMEKIISSFKEI